LFYISIKNTGDKPLEELSLKIPISGSYKLILDNQEEKKDKFNRVIKLENLNPTASYRIYIWSPNNYSLPTEYGDNEYNVTHKYGTFEVLFPSLVYGRTAWLLNNQDVIIFAFLFIVGFILIIVLMIHEEKKKKSKENSGNTQNVEEKKNENNEINKETPLKRAKNNPSAKK
jgi:hypothetical protein